MRRWGTPKAGALPDPCEMTVPADLKEECVDLYSSSSSSAGPVAQI